MLVTVVDLDLALCRLKPLLNPRILLEDDREAPFRVRVEFLHLIQALAEPAEVDAPNVLLLVYGRTEVHGRFARRTGVVVLPKGSGKLLYEQSQFLIKLCESMIYWLFWR